jgi:hypothetical protein
MSKFEFSEETITNFWYSAFKTTFFYHLFLPLTLKEIFKIFIFLKFISTNIGLASSVPRRGIESDSFFRFFGKFSKNQSFASPISKLFHKRISFDQKPIFKNCQ